MSPVSQLDLVAQVRHLADDVARHDPDEAARLFDELVSEHGRARLGTALLWAAPDIGRLPLEAGPDTREGRPVRP